MNFELIIADDCSDDGTQEIIKKYCKLHKNIKPIFRTSNTGVQHNLLDAMSQAPGKYIALCEGDDYWLSSHKLKQQLDMMENDQKMTISFHRVKILSPRKDNGVIFPFEDSVNFDLPKLLDYNYIQTNSAMYRNLFKYMDVIDGKILPLDWYLHIYHAHQGEIGFIDKAMSIYRRHSGGV